MHRLVFLLVFAMTGFSWPAAFAQDKDANFDQVLSDSLGAPEFKEAEKPETKEEADLPQLKLPEVTDLSSLGQLAPFSDVAVIQRRYLPKSQRFEAFPGLGLIMNDAFFLSTALSARLAYYFSDMWGVEANLGLYSTGERKVTKDLIAEPRRVSTKAFIVPKQYMGADVKWSPIYGKLGWFNHSIVPFDMYFALGGGVVNTNQDTTPAGVHLGTGQTFALSKGMALRWDLSWYWYTSETTVSGKKEISSFLNLVGTVGVSFFFPEAKYR